MGKVSGESIYRRRRFHGIVFKTEDERDDFARNVHKCYAIQETIDKLPANAYSQRNIAQYKIRCLIVNPLLAIAHNQSKLYTFSKTAEQYLKSIGEDFNIDFVTILNECRLASGVQDEKLTD